MALFDRDLLPNKNNLECNSINKTFLFVNKIILFDAIND